MTSALKFVRRPTAHREQGYILLTLMFLATLVVLSLAAITPQLTQQIKRDQEEELIHRGVQYSRAIQHFYKKTGRYPTRLEELDNFNNIRFLRKHYKDPITGEDFKLLHFGEVPMMLGGTGMPAAAAAAMGGGGPFNNGGGAFNNGGGGFNNGGGTFNNGGGTFNNGGGPFNNQVANQPINNQGFGNGFGNQGFGAQAGFMSQQQPSQQQSSQQQTANQPNPDDTSNATQPVSQLTDNANNPSNSGAQNLNPTVSPNSNAQVFGGGPVIGVASTSKKKSIREFNKKNHYKDWLFIYDPGSDRGGLLNTPAQPNLMANSNNSNNSTPGNAPPGPGQGQGQAPQGMQPNSFGGPMPMPNQPPDQMQQPPQ